MTLVEHRNGSTTLLDITKIRDAIEWASEGLDVNQIELESLFSTRLKDKVTTREIQNNLISHCLELCTLESPEWRYVAGRLHMWSLWKEVKVIRKVKSIEDLYHSSFDAILLKINQGIYTSKILEYWTIPELQKICRSIVPELDKDYDYAGAKLLTSRYLIENELPQESFLVNAFLLAAPSLEWNDDRGQVLGLAVDIYNAISQRKISLATPILGNLRLPNLSVTSCFIINVEDDLTSIFDAVSNAAEISKQGGGIGICLSKIRATGSWVRGRANSSGGVVPWIKIFNDTALAVNQGGKRAGSITTALDIWHLDIPEFLDMQTEHGDQRRKAYDVFPQVVLSDEFMRRVESNEDWTLVDPYEVKKVFGYELATMWGYEFEKAYKVVEYEILGIKKLFDCSVNNDPHNSRITLYKRVKAKDLFKQIMRLQIETGLPYLCFKDTINESNPNTSGIIPCVNLCTESFSIVNDNEAHCCDLVSLNLANIDVEEELGDMVRLSVTILDNSLEIASPPIKEAIKHHNKYRVLGIGAMGLADWLAKNKNKYSESLHKIEILFETIACFGYEASINLAKERGVFPAYNDSEFKKGLINGKPLEWYQKNSLYFDDIWSEIFKELNKYGIRNSQLIAIAPNTSSSLVQGCSASILPIYNRFFFDKAKGSLPIAPPFIKDCFWYYEENKNLSQQVIVDTVAAIQRWVDTGISMELLFNLNNGITGKDIYDILLSAWKQKVKAVYYIRTVQKDDFQEECLTCAN